MFAKCSHRFTHQSTRKADTATTFRSGSKEIVAKLRQVEVLQSQGMVIGDSVGQIGVTEVTYYFWRGEYGGMRTAQLQHIKGLEQENAKLRRAVFDLPDRILVASDMASVRQGP